MKYIAIIFLLVLPCLASRTNAQEQDNKQRTFLLTGASFATKVNGWFELGCETLGANGINRAKGGTAIADMANQMTEGTLYSREELDDLDALVIMHVVNRDVFDESALKEKYSDYETPFDRSNYAIAFDYVIKKFLTECYELKDDENSKYYGTTSGKPAVIILCTDWQDGRTMYNESVRKLADKWGLPMVEFDKKIGFSKNVPHPVTGEQTSLLYAQDTQTISGETFGWHPLRGQDEYIQQRMSAVFADVIRSILPFQE